MFKFCNLYSGSSGNCSFIKTENTQILVDCGVSSKRIEEALSSIGESVDNINAIIISHEHSDHVKGLAAICKNIIFLYTLILKLLKKLIKILLQKIKEALIQMKNLKLVI